MREYKNRRCFVPGCRSGLATDRAEKKKNGVKNPSLLSAPKDPKLLAIWEKVIGRTDRPLTSKDVVCELHFKDEEISRYREIRGLPGGAVYRIERYGNVLKKDAVPSIFPPPGSCKSRKKRGRPPRKTSAYPDRRECSISNEEDSVEECLPEKPSTSPNPVECVKSESEDCIEDRLTEKPSESPNPEECAISDVEDCAASMVMAEVFDFQVLRKAAHNIVLPSVMWTAGVVNGNQVVFANWSDGETFEAQKRVLIDDELQVKIFFGNINASLNNMKEVHSLSEVGAYLIVIDKLNICPSSRSPKCMGYTIPKDIAKKETSADQCRNCQKVEKDLLSLNNGEEEVGRVELQNTILGKQHETHQLADHLHMKKRNVSVDKVVSPEGKPSPEATPKRSVHDESCAVDNCDMELVKEVGVEELTPHPKCCSLTTPLRLLSPTLEDLLRVTLSPSETIEKKMGEGTSSLNIETLVKDVRRISLPSDSWTLGVLKGKRLIFVKWKADDVLVADKRLVVDEELSIKVIFGNMILDLGESRYVTKFEDIRRFLYIIDKMSKCNGIETGRRASSCPVYFIPGLVSGIQFCYIRCPYCQGASEEAVRIRRLKRGHENVKAEAQGKVWKNLKMLSDLYPEMKKGVKTPAP
ncbi:uncharacterized protein LOC124162804 [Ischnura elegans]|uniref:uncharacterized protein LOC124162804 n=1 Tax=Ischnura elegans TaxID=197161 RepID=UPI001ED8BCC0|nr:uncharacterized protein LOC124162804 [Ischnura elegans]